MPSYQTRETTPLIERDDDGLQTLRAKWQEQRVNKPDWKANAVQCKAAYDVMRERRAA